PRRLHDRPDAPRRAQGRGDVRGRRAHGVPPAPARRSPRHRGPRHRPALRALHHEVRTVTHTAMHLLSTPEIWLLCGSQHLYGPGPPKTVAANAQEGPKTLDASTRVPLPVRFKGLLTTPDEIRRTLLEANADASCAGVILWMHTFS